jgi:hypothetical protein
MSAQHTPTWAAYTFGSKETNPGQAWLLSGPIVISLPVGYGYCREDALMLAAAPDLLEALKKCAAVCAGEALNKSALTMALESACAAIRKAEGGTNGK